MSNPSNDRMARLRANREKLRRGKKRDEILVGIAAVVVALVVIAAAVLLGGLLTMLAWNVGVVGIVSACGGSVGTISLGIAICANIAIGIVGRIFRRAPATATTA